MAARRNGRRESARSVRQPCHGIATHRQAADPVTTKKIRFTQAPGCRSGRSVRPAAAVRTARRQPIRPLPAGKTSALIVGRDAGQRAKDQARMAFGRRHGPRPSRSDDPGPEIIDRKIGRADQVSRDRKIHWAFDVQCDAALGGMPSAVRPVDRRERSRRPGRLTAMLPAAQPDTGRNR